MILSNECFCQDTCRKYQLDKCNCSDGFFCLKLFKLNFLYDAALVSLIQRKHLDLKLDIDEIDREPYSKLKEIQDYIEKFVQEGKNLYIHSPICGNGKTAWSLRLLQTYFEQIWYKSDLQCRGLFINVPRFLLTLKDSITNPSEYINYIKNNVLTADLVIWDEVATKSLTVYEHEHLLSLVNARLDQGKSNIYTSNMYPQELSEKLGERLYSRVVNLSTDIEFKGADKRGL